MSPRQEELQRHREALQWRCAAQRLRLQTGLHGVEGNLDWLDRGLSIARRLRQSPYLTAGAIAVLLVLGPGKIFRMLTWGSRAALLVSAYKKLHRK